MLDSKLHFHCHADYVHSQALRTLGLICCITYNFSSLDSLVVLYNALAKARVCLTIIRKYSKKICQFVSLLVFQFDILRNYDLILNCLNFRTLYSRR
jgi:hypothetical protein